MGPSPESNPYFMPPFIIAILITKINSDRDARVLRIRNSGVDCQGDNGRKWVVESVSF